MLEDKLYRKSKYYRVIVMPGVQFLTVPYSLLFKWQCTSTVTHFCALRFGRRRSAFLQLKLFNTLLASLHSSFRISLQYILAMPVQYRKEKCFD